VIFIDTRTLTILKKMDNLIKYTFIKKSNNNKEVLMANYNRIKIFKIKDKTFSFTKEEYLTNGRNAYSFLFIDYLNKNMIISENNLLEIIIWNRKTK
jgi:hypothetical protein